mgnify:CR=1 FL=1|jgi:hypothetical protein
MLQKIDIENIQSASAGLIDTYNVITHSYRGGGVYSSFYSGSSIYNNFEVVHSLD